VSTAAATAAALDNAKKMAYVLLVRGLQLQAAGDPTAFVSAYRTVVALARNLRNGSGLLPLVASLDVERVALQTADRWLERLAGGSDLPLMVARIAAEADDPTPFDTRPHILADRFVIRGLMQAPNQWLGVNLSRPVRRRSESRPRLILSPSPGPCRGRRSGPRLVGLAPDAAMRAEMTHAQRPTGGGMLVRNRTVEDMIDDETQNRVVRRALILKAAVRAFLADRGRPPAALVDLVAAGYLVRLPKTRTPRSDRSLPGVGGEGTARPGSRRPPRSAEYGNVRCASEARPGGAVERRSGPD